MAELVLGPLLRHVGETHATIWVETSAPCTVEILGHSSSTFCIEGHHFALVTVKGLAPGGVHPYEVHLDGARQWPERDSRFPQSVIRTLGQPEPLRVAFGSCRVSLPHEPPYTLSQDEDPKGRGHDALYALALRLTEQPVSDWPDLLVMIGDQVYADEVSPGTREFIRQRRNFEGPHGEAVGDFEEYCHLYLEAWGDPTLRWLLSTVPTSMIFDDHDVHDDWNTSQTWRQEVRAEGWWDEHIISALSSYWVFQHIGNLSPDELEEDELFAKVCDAEDASALLRDFASRADRHPESTQWSYVREIGGSKLVVIDSRASRVLDPGRRSLIDEEEWEWLEKSLTGDVDHLLIATSLPFLLAPALHDLEAWSEAVCEGAWGRAFKRLGEKVRQALDLEHWAAFQSSFQRLARLLEATASGQRGKAPASIVVLSGDVHHAYLAEVAFPKSSNARSVVYQAVCSPFRNELDSKGRATVRIACGRATEAIARLLARTAGQGSRPIHWRLTRRKPMFDNQVAQVELRGGRATVSFEKAVGSDDGAPQLVENLRRELVA